MVLSTHGFCLILFVGRDYTEFSFKAGYDAWQNDIEVKIIILMVLIGFGYQFKDGRCFGSVERAIWL